MKKFITRLLFTLFAGLSLTMAGLRAAPVITTQPAAPAQGVYSGGSATFTVTATGTGTLTYQWRRGGIALPAATGGSYTLSGVTRAAAGIYDVVVTDASGSTTSQPFLFAITPTAYPGQITADANWDPNPLTISTRVYAAAPLANGQWLVAGEFVRWGLSARAGLARLNADYSLDTTWQSPVVNGIVYALAVAPDGTVYFGGDFTAVDSLPRAGLARLTGSGLTHDVAWKSTDVVSTAVNSVTALAVQDDGKPLVARTSFVTGAVTGTNVLHRLNADGSLDSTFSVNIAMNAGSHIYSIIAEPGTNAKIAFGGVFISVNGTTRNGVARVDSTGATLDTAFGGTAGTNNTVFTFTRLSDGRYLVGGAFTTIGGLTRNRIALLDAGTGNVNTTFAPATTGTTNGIVSAATVLSDGRIFAGGSFTLFQGNNAAGLVRLNGTTGAFDSALTVGGNVAQTSFFSSTTAGRNLAATTLSGDNVLLFGIFNQLLGQRRIGVAVVNSDGTLAGSPSSLAYRPAYTGGGFLEADGKFTLFGSIDVVGNTSGLGQAIRIKPDGTLDSTFPGGSGFGLNGLSTFGIYRAVRQGDGKYVAIGDFVTYNGATANRLVRINTDGSIDQSFNAGSGPSNYILPPTALSGGRLILTGIGFGTNNTFSYNGTPVNGNIMRLNANGSLDTAFSTGVGGGFSNAPTAVIENPDQSDPTSASDLLVAVGFNGTSYGTYGGQSIPGLVRLNGDGTRDPSFNPAGPSGGAITGFLYLADGRLVIYGSFTSYNGTAVNRFAIIDPDSGNIHATSFAMPAAVDAAINQVVLQEDGKFIVTGDFSGGPAYRVTSSGVIDTTFGLNGTTGYPGGSGATRLTIGDNGSVYLNASLVSLNNGSPRGVARFMGTAKPPTITLQPVGGATAVGGSRTLTVAATSNSAGALTYQWRKNGQNLAVASAATLTLTGVSATDAGAYDVVVSDGASTTASVPVQIDVTPANYGSIYRARPNFARVEYAGGANAIVPISGGGFYVVGSFTRIDGTVSPGIARFLGTGAVDTAYTPATVAGTIWSAAVQADGKLVIGGNFRLVGGVARNNIARLNTDGTLDQAFNPGTGFNATVNALAVQTDGRILAGGNFTNYNNTNRLDVARLNPDGSLDTGYGSATNGLNGTVSTLVLQADGKAVVGGTFTNFGTTTANRLARLNTDGSLDTAFATALGTGFDSTVNVVVLDATGIVVGGQFSNFNTAAAGYLMRLTSAGARDTAFLPANAGPAFTVNSLARDAASGNLYVGGYFGAYGGMNRFALARVNGATGALDSTFTPNMPSTPSVLGVMTDGKVVVSGGWVTINNLAHHGIVKFATDGTVDPGLTAAMHAPGIVSAIVPVANGQYVIGGGFSFVNDAPVSNLARINANGTVDTSFGTGSFYGPGGNVYALLAQPDGRIVVGGNFSTFNGANCGSLVRLNASGVLDGSFANGSNFNALVSGLALQPDGRIIAVGTFTAYTGSAALTNRIARLNADGTVDTGFSSAVGTGINGTYPSIVRLQSDGKILVSGSFATINGLNVGNIARLNADGSPDTAFITTSGSGFLSGVNTLALQADGRIVAGGFFPQYNGTNRSNIASLTSTGAIDTTFAPPNNNAFNNYVAGLALQSDAKIVAFGNFTSYSGTTRNVFARLNANGTLDTGFNVPSAQVVVSPPTPTAPVVGTPDGNFLVGGSRFDFAEGVFSGLILLESAPVPAITTQPVSQTAAGGENITFSVTATGENLAYQWFKDGVAVSGGTGSSLTLNSVTIANAGTYTVTVTNLYGSVTSSPVTLTGSSPAPTIGTQPLSSSWTLGASRSLVVGASGSGSITYQWRKFGMPISGATSATYQVNNVTLADAGLYDVVVSNGLTSIVSSVAQVTTVPASYPNVLRPRSTFNPRIEGIGNAYSIIPVTGGGFYALGSFTRIDGTVYNGAVRFLASGALDTTFVTPVITGNILAAVAQADGKLVIGGSFRLVGGVSRNFIARLNSNGTLDTTFAAGTGFNAAVNALALQTDGRIVAGGNFNNYNGTTRLDVARLNADGSLDNSFGATTGLNGAVNALAIQGDGKVVIGGNFATFNSTTTASRLARLNADGTLDTAFSTASGSGANSAVNAVVLDGTGKIIIGGAFGTYNGTSRLFLARINADGTLDSTFLPTNAGPNSTVNSIALDSTGKIIIGGLFGNYAGATRSFVARVNPADGTVDTTFAGSTNSNVTAVAVLTDGKIAASGFFTQAGGVAHTGIAKFNTDGTVDAGVSAGLRQPGTVNAVVPLASGQWLIGGSFLWSNDVSTTNLARLNADGSTDTTYATALGVGFNSPVNTLAAQPDGKLYVGGNFSGFNNVFTGRANLIRLNADGTFDAGFVTSFNGSVTALTLQANGKLLVGGNFTTYNNGSVTTGVTRLARLNTDGTLDGTFATTGTGFNNTVNTVRVQTDGKILAGGFFNTYNGTATGDFIRLNADGTADTSLQAGTAANGSVYSVVPRIDGRIWVGGAFITFNGVQRSDLVLLTSAGALDGSYAPTTQYNNSVYAILPQSDGKVVTLGNFTSFGGANRSFFNRANANGTVDTAFNVPTALLGLGIPTTAQLNYLADGTLLASGGRFDFAEGTYSGLVLLEAAPVPVIMAAPVAQSADPAGSVTFSVTATGNNLTYQWQKNGVNIAGATGGALTVSNIGLGDYGAYTVVITNVYGSVTSAPASLTPVTPLILDQPVGQRAVLGGRVDFHVSATGTGTIAYQWKKDGTNVTGGTAADLSLTGLTAADAGSYSVTVSTTNPSASVTSSAATLTLLPADALFWQQATPDSPDLSPGRTVHDGQGGVYLPWTTAQSGLDMVGGKFVGQLARLHESDGTVDPAFKLDRRYHRVAFAVTQPDGKLLLSVDTGDASTVIRVDPATGAVDSSFNAPLFNYGIRFLTLQKDGRVLVAATDNANGNAPSSAINYTNPTVLRLNANGSYDSTFSAVTLNSGTVVFWPPAINPADTQGRIYLAGSFNSINGTTIYGLARLSSTGALDTTFGTPSVYPAGYAYGAIRTVSFQSDGRIVATGQGIRYTARGSNADPVMAIRFNVDGTFDTTFAQPLRSATGLTGNPGVAIRAVLMQAGDQFLGVSDRIIRFNADGSIDSSFTPHAMTPEAFWLTAGSDGRLYVPVVSTVYGQGGSIPVWGSGIAAFSAAGVPDFSFQTGGWGRSFYPTSANVLSDGRVVVAGNFNRYGSTPVPGVALFGADGSPAANQPQLSSAGFPLPGQTFATVASAGNDQTYAIWGNAVTGAAQLIRMTSAGLLDSTYAPQVPTTISLGNTALFAAPGNKLLLASSGVGAAQALSGVTSGAIVRLAADGTVDTAFAASVANLARVDRSGTGNSVSLITLGALRVLQVLPDGRMLVTITDTNGSIRLLRLLAGGGIDSTFNPPDFGNATPSSGFTSPVLDPTTGVTAQFNLVTYDANLIATAVQSPTGQVYLGGRFNFGNGVPRGLVRLNADGSPDYSFTGSGIDYTANPAAGPYVASLVADTTGRIYAGGRLNRWNGNAVASGIFRLRADGSFDSSWSPAISVMDYAANTYLSLQLAGGNLYAFGSVGAPGESYPSKYKVIALDTPPAATIAASPLSQSVLPGGTINLSVSAVSVENLTYQWRLNGNAIAGATSATYTVSGATAANAGTYDVVVRATTSGVNFTSGTALVTVVSNGAYLADPAFTRPQLRQTAYPSRITLAPDGKYYATWVNGGYLTGANGQRLGAVIRLNADGTLDPSFRTGGVLASAIAIVFQSDGKLLVGGCAATEGDSDGTPVFRVFRLNTDGSLDSTYQSPKFGNLPRFMTMQSDGKLLVVPSDGGGQYYDGYTTLARLNADGTADASFQVPTLDSNSGFIFAPPVLDGTGRIYIAGTFITVNGVTRVGVARLLASGAVDTTFVPSGFIFPNGQLRGIAVQTQGANAGKVLIAGGTLRLTTDSGTVNRAVLRLTATGAVDTTFPLITQASAGQVVRPRLLNLAADDSFTIVGGTVARYTADGVADSSFVRPQITLPSGPLISTAQPESYWLVSQPDGKQVITADFGIKINGASVPACVRFNADGSIDSTFTPPTFQGEVYQDFDLSVGADGLPVVIGAFDTVNGTARVAAARFNTDGSLTTLNLTGPSGLKGANGGYLRADGKLILGTQVGPTYLSSVGGIQLYNTDGTVDSTFVLDATAAGVIGGDSEVLLAPGSKLIVGSGYAQQIVNGSAYFQRINPDGSVDTSFVPAANNYGAVYRNGSGSITRIVEGRFAPLAVYPDGRVLVSATPGTAGQNAQAVYPFGMSSVNVTLLRFNADGSLDQTFVTPTLPASLNQTTFQVTDGTSSVSVSGLQVSDGPYQKAIVQSDGKILIGGNITSIGGVATYQLARLNADGSVDPTFSIARPSTVARAPDDSGLRAVGVAPDGKYWVAGVFNTYNGAVANGIARLNTDGTVDPTFATDIAWRPFGLLPPDDGDAKIAIAFGNDGSAYVGGSFAKSDDVFPYVLTRLAPSSTGPALTAPVITAQPAATASVNAGKSLTLTVTATGNPAPAYQWYLGATPIAGATGASYTIGAATSADVGSYTVQVSNSQGTVTSTAAVVTVNVAPTITTQPLSATVTAGQNATFSVVASGTGTLTYQWKKGTTALQGQTGATLVLQSVTSGDAGSYAVDVANAVGLVTSSAATLTVNTPPAFTTNPTGQTVLVGATVTFTAAASGSPAPTYQWRKNGVDIAGATSATYTIASAQLSDAGEYTVVITNAVTSVTSPGAVLVFNTAPAFTTQPASQSVTAGTNVTFTAAASGNPAPTYQWKKNGSVIAGATAATYTITSVQPSDATTYTVVATNAVSSTESAAATLTVNTAPVISTQPVGSSVISGASVSFTVVATGSPAPTYQWKKDNAAIAGATDATLTLQGVTPASAGSYTVDVSNVAGTVTSSAATLTVYTASVFTTQPISQTVTAGANVTFTAVASGNPAPTYQWVKNGTAIDGATSGTYTISNAQPGDAGSYAVLAKNTAGTVSSATATLTVNTPPVFTTVPTAQIVFTGTSVTFTAAASGSPAPTYQWRKNGAAIAGATSASYTIASAQFSDAGEYSVVATNVVTSITSPGAVLSFNIAPAITTQPVGQTVTVGANVTFTAAASGNPAPTYQWQKNGINLQGATSTTLTLTSVSLDAAGVYTVVATNAAGSVTSGFANLAVNPVPVAPAITTQPVAQTVTAGTPVTLAVVATGTPAPTYQWQKNGVDLAGATNATLTLGNPVVGDSGNYAVRVTNSVSAVTSSVAVLTVNALVVKPTITSQPVNQTVTAGNTAAFIVTADGTAPLSYQWRLNGNAIVGATSSVYVIANAQSANAGSYTVFVSNTAGDATSNAATLTVNPVVTAPAITTQPAAATVTAGTAVTFTVAATGTAPLTYIWQRNGSAIAGATGASYTIQSPQVADSGSYNVVVSNSAGFAISNAAALTVNAAGIAPAFTTVPASQAVTEGGGVTFTAAATGTPAPTYQWRKNGADIAGANAATYTIAATSGTNAGSYTVKASNTVGDAVSAPASLTVNPRIVAPAISGATTAATPLNSAYSYQIVASNNPTAYTALNLPAGLTLNTATGLISGTPTASGTFVITIGASNTGGAGSATLTLTVVAPAPVINSAPAPVGTIRAKSSFGYQITATNSPTSFAAVGLPDGLTLNTATGAIIGSPTVSGNFVVTLTATNTSGTSVPFTLTLNIVGALSVPVVNSDAVAGAKVGGTFVYVITASNSPTSFAATGLPDGVTLNATTGVIRGTPTTAGISTMSVTASNADGTSAALSVLVTIDPSDTAPVISSSTTDTTTVRANYSYQIVASNTPTSYSATGLPDGLTINSATGLISGSPSIAGTSAVLLTATNAGGTGSAALLLTVQPGLSAPVITGSAAKDGTVGDGTFSYQIVASNTPTAFAATGLPDGLTLNTATGIISGSPRAAGIYTASLTASNTAGTGAAFALKITIKAAAQAPSITSDASTTQTSGPGAFFSYQITATNGPLTGYSATGLPSGLTLDPITGLISGAPAAGTYAVVISASNAGGTSNPLALLITIKAGASAPSITSSLTADATQRAPFTYLVTASNMPNVSPLPAGNGYTATGLPAGLALNPSNGIITGSISGTGSYNVVLTATNDAGTSDAKTLVITVNAPANAPTVTSGDTDSVVAGSAYGYQITATNSPTSFDASDRPAWLSVVTGSGIVFGTPTVPGIYTTKLTASNATGTSAARTLTITVTAAAGTPTVTSTLLASGIATGSFSYQIVAAPGPITAYYVAGALPDGLGLDSTTGLISGTPTIPGTYTIPISAANAKGIGAAKPLVITIDAAPGSPVVDLGSGTANTTRRSAGARQAAAAATLTASGTVNVPFVYQIVASNNPSGYLASDLPPGLALNPVTGLISGTPAQAGTFTSQIGATNSVGVGATSPITITIAPPPTAPAVTSTLTATGTAGTAFSYQILASNTPTSFNAVGVPAGLSLNSTTGIIAGTPTAPGTYHVTISANNNVGTGATADLVLTLAASASAPAISSASTATGTVANATFSYQIVASNSPTRYGATGLPAGLTLNTTTGAITGTPVTSGQYSATLTATNASGASTPFTLTLTIAPSAATSAINSASTATVVAGHSFTYVISATNAPVSYNISGLPAGLTADTTAGTISGIPTVPGTYAITLSANNLTGTGASFVLALTVAVDPGTPEPQPPVGGHLVNLSTRANVGSGGNVLIVGFVIGGSDPKPVMIRGVGGQILKSAGISAPLADPVLDLYQGNTVINHNDNWAATVNGTDIATVANRVGAFPLSANSPDAVIYTTLQPGVYTAIFSSSNTTTGVGLVEIYDTQDNLTTTTPRLTNISSRGQVGTGENLMIGGFVVSGDQPKQLLIRGVGPGLVPHGIDQSQVLADPVIYLYKDSAVIATNDNWGSAGDGAAISATAAVVGAFPLTAGSKDAAMLVTLQPGRYTVMVAGANSTSGVALVELYEVQ
ncbi:MAG: immunoglobulin domain-containing protein [Verrucomicrobia bacterium]|nr:immunoglobulin domain-containing protein [Verrucomicrobiota bacterium]